MKIDFQDKTFIKIFFNNGGYVLDFSNSTFSSFTFHSIGIDIQGKYQLSKGKSFESFVDEGPDDLVLKLSLDLLQYYENLPDSSLEKSDERTVLAEKLKKRLLLYQDVATGYFSETTQSLSSYFDSSYIDKQISIMLNMIKESPTDSIGKAKELLESCFKHILDRENIEYNNSDNISTLQKKVFRLLNLDANHNISAKNNDDVKRVLSGLNQIVSGINNLRNDKGDGHGKGLAFTELPSRYATLVVNSSVTLINFIWDTYSDRKDK
ncbi:TPA: abortive infection family protein [Streptococcus suis]|nr:abortive infection family protein [Streptococcus suis]HEM4275431.1 abortive infection family protein [Streptococcus suis]